MTDIRQLSTPDEEIVRQVCAGHRDMFTELVIRHQRSIYAVAYGVVGNHADAEEVLQESFLKALLHLQTFRGEASFRTWLTRITLNEARMRLRKYRPRLYDSLDEAHETEDGFHPKELRDWRPSPEERLSQAEMKRLIEKAIRKLPRIYREVFVLREVEQLSSEETAAALNVSVSAAKTRLLRARLMMREALAVHFRRRWYDRFLNPPGK